MKDFYYLDQSSYQDIKSNSLNNEINSKYKLNSYNIIKNQHNFYQLITNVERWELTIVLFIFLVITFLVSLIPLFSKLNKYNRNFLGLANSFKAAVGFSTAMFIILPKSSDDLSHYFSRKGSDFNHIIADFKWTYLTAFGSYVFSLIVLKILFSSEGGHHHHNHNHNHNHHHNHNHDSNNLVNSIKNSETTDKEVNNNELDEDELAFKNLVGTRGRFGTFMGLKNIIKSSIISNKKDVLSNKSQSVLRSSLLVSKSMMCNKDKNDDLNYLVNPSNIHENLKKEPNTYDNKEINNSIEILEKKETIIEEKLSNRILLAYLLSGITGLQGFSIGLCIGTVESKSELVLTSLCLIIYKCIEHANLGFILKENKLDNTSYIRMMLIQVIFLPLGILIAIVTKPSYLYNGLVSGLGVGVLIYQSCTETVIEEFAFTEHRYSKFIIYMLGGIFVGGSSVIKALL